MFEKLFAENGLSLERLRVLLEVGVAGSIVKAADGDPVRQSQYSRQIKELEEFFRIKLIERQGKGMRLTGNGKELARISRFFMLGLSNFRRGCLAETQTFRIGASATFIRQFLLPAISGSRNNTAYITETAGDEEIERRLHDLTLDYGVVSNSALSRPLQTKRLGKWKLQLWIPASLKFGPKEVLRQIRKRELPLVLAKKEMNDAILSELSGYEAKLVCDNFLEVKSVMEEQQAAVFLPDFLEPVPKSFVRVRWPAIETRTFHYHLAWNPRLVRLNPHAGRNRDVLAQALADKLT